MSKLAIKALFGLPGLFILTTGLVFVTSPESALEKLQLSASGAEGLSNIRGLAGGPLVAVGASLLLGAITEKLEYVRPAVFFLLTLLTARVLSYVVDGPIDAIGLFLAIPSIVFGMLIAGHVLLNRSEKAAALSGKATHA
ncbi:MAG: DUF4345 family protein [Proteobacteria bacterium]|nr:DUF4345 family protein [Pseudomonadota bacterium]